MGQPVAIDSQLGEKIYKYDTNLAFLYKDVDQALYVLAPDSGLWPDLIPEDSCLQLKKTQMEESSLRQFGHGMCASRHG